MLKSIVKGYLAGVAFPCISFSH